ncbi:winged helix-turn-helix transcriptional regulator [Candidatus Bathyarchaeota archaeon]|nr:MAG: winged helix-turn-helix transcriptional regulator [Candidatus Bathyarchaeota archaeon]
MPEKPSLANVLSSSGRIKILTVLSNVGELHLSEIARKTDQSYSATDRHLQELSEASIVEEHDYGRVRMFRLNLENPRAKILRQLILEWDNSTTPKMIDGQA